MNRIGRAHHLCHAADRRLGDHLESVAEIALPDAVESKDSFYALCAVAIAQDGKLTTCSF